MKRPILDFFKLRARSKNKEEDCTITFHLAYEEWSPMQFPRFGQCHTFSLFELDEKDLKYLEQKYGKKLGIERDAKIQVIKNEYKSIET